MTTWTPDEIERRAILESGLAVAVNVRKRGPHARLVPWAASVGLLEYVGHAVRYSDWPQTEWANPFRPKKGAALTDEIAAALLANYERHIRVRPHLMSGMWLLKGHALGCWCAPSACHAETLARLVNEASKPSLRTSSISSY